MEEFCQYYGNGFYHPIKPKPGVASKRQWRFTKLGNSLSLNPSRNNFEFTVFSYNILSQSTLDQHGYLYLHCQPMCLLEDYRMTNIQNEILDSRASVICLQEVEEHIFDEFLAVLRCSGYRGVYKQRTGKKTDGCCIFWRDAQFQCLEQRAVEFKVEGLKQLSRDNIGLIVCLRPRFKNLRDIRLHVATTHLLYNPKRGDVKLCQLRLFLAELDEMALDKVEHDIRHYHPIVLCGDFNMEPRSALYNFLELCTIPVRPSMEIESLSGQLDGLTAGTPLLKRDVSLEKINVNSDSKFISKEDGDKPSSNSKSESKKKDDRFFHDISFISSQYFTTGSENSKVKKVWTSIVGQKAASVDHIFYTLKRLPDDEYNCRNFCEDRIFLVGSLELMSREKFMKMGGLPNFYLSSDHICVMSKFVILPSKVSKPQEEDSI